MTRARLVQARAGLTQVEDEMLTESLLILVSHHESLQRLTGDDRRRFDRIYRTLANQDEQQQLGRRR